MNQMNGKLIGLSLNQSQKRNLLNLGIKRNRENVLAEIVTGDLLGTIGVFLSGAGSLLTAFGAIHYEKKRGERECAERFDKFMAGLKLRDELNVE